jgi:activator of Hsp90 ATPase-like protein
MKIDKSIVIKAPGKRILAAFFDPGALRAWWGVRDAVTTPRALGPYALEWPSSELRDEVLGSLGGVFRGTVVQFDSASGFFVADLYWLPPEGDPIGPMALDVMVAPEVEGTRLRVTQSGFDETGRWRRYYEVVDLGWERALASLKRLLERQENELPAHSERQQQR